jgi:hypothetical protein
VKYTEREKAQQKIGRACEWDIWVYLGIWVCECFYHSFVFSPFVFSERSLYRCTVDVGKLPNHVNIVFLLSICLFFFKHYYHMLFRLFFVCVRDSRPFAQH